MKNTYRVNEEAVKKIAERVYDNGSTVINRNDLEQIFPELKESEDEQIRKELIQYFSAFTLETFAGLSPKKIIAWLEKQGEQCKYGYIQTGKKYKCIVSPSYTTFKTGNIYKPENTFIWSLMNLCHDCFELVDEEQKSMPKFKVGDKIQYLKDCGIPFLIEKIENGEYIFGNNMGHTTIESGNKWYLAEQRSSDKVEPKFHKGEWITNGDYTWKIIEVKPLDYILQSQDGNIVDDTIFYVDGQFHSFTIEDAKDGDVLYNEDSFAGNSVFIYNGCISDKTDACLYYTRLFKDKDFSVYNDVMWKNGGGISGGKFYPATKEQREHLEKATADAGYTFDFENKELKKIKQKPAWSEEDEKRLTKVLVTLNNAYASKELLNWVESLKDRVQPQPKQKWKQENTGDLTDFENAMMHIGGSFFGDNAGLDPNDTNTIKEQANILLELVPIKEWSEEDERYLSYAIHSVEDMLGNNGKNTVTWLKSLHPQKQWKPTKEQMEAISLAVHDSHSRSYHKELYSLKLDLSKLTE